MGRLDRAIAASRDRYDVTVSWLPFFLRPQMPKEGHAKGGTPSDRVGNWLRSLNAKEGPEIISRASVTDTQTPSCIMSPLSTSKQNTVLVFSIKWQAVCSRATTRTVSIQMKQICSRWGWK